jgi:formate dehydrogenase alpha subunit
MTTRVLTTCPYCGTGCTLYLQVRSGQVIGVLPDVNGIGQGKLCIKGWSAHEFVHHRDRLTRPLIRMPGTLRSQSSFREASWDEALTLVVERLLAIREAHGPNALGFLASAKCTNEENYLLQKLARAGIGTHNVDHCARQCHSPTVTGLVDTMGSGAMTNSIDEILGADVILVIGSNTNEQHPLIARRVIRAVRERGARLIVADPRAIGLAGLAEVFVRQQPGTDVALLNGMMHVILREGLADEAFIAERIEAESYAALKATIASYPPERAAEITGVPADDIRRAARLYGQADKATILYAMGITQHITGTDNVHGVANLAMLTGNVGRESTGVNPLRGQNNVQGACDVGALPDVYSGYQRVTDEQVHAKFAQAWGQVPPARAGLTLSEMVNAAGDDIRGLYLMAENSLLSDPDVNHVRAAFERLDFVVVQDIFLTETAQMADVILPGASFAEKDGTFTNTERRVQRVRKAVEPPGEARPDWEILCEVGKRLNGQADRWAYRYPAEVMDEIAALTPIYGGVAYNRLEGKGLQWPCPDANHPGTPYLHKERFASGKGRFMPDEYLPPAELPDDDYPLLLTTGRVLFHYHTGTMTRRSPTLTEQVNEAFVEIHPENAARLGVAAGDTVRVASRRGQIELAARVTEIVPPGVVFIPFHFAEAAANVLTHAALDPRAKIPEYKVCAVRVTRV